MSDKKLSEKVDELLGEEGIRSWGLAFVTEDGIPYISYNIDGSLGWGEVALIHLSSRSISKHMVREWKYYHTEHFNGSTVDALNAEYEILNDRIEDIERHLDIDGDVEEQ